MTNPEQQPGSPYEAVPLEKLPPYSGGEIAPYSGAPAQPEAPQAFSPSGYPINPLPSETPTAYAPPTQQYSQPYPPGYAPYSYTYPNFYPYVGSPGTNGLAITALILSCVGMVTCGVGSVFGLVLGFIANSQVKRSGQHGGPIAKLAIGISAAFLLFWAAEWIYIVVNWDHLGNES